MNLLEKMKKQTIDNIFFIIITSIIYLEILIRINIFQGIHFTFFYSLLIGFGFGTLIVVITQLFSKKVQIMIQSLILFLLCLYFSSQILYHDFFKSFLTIYSLGNGGQVAEFYKDILQLIYHNLIWIILCFLPFIIYICYFRKRAIYNEKDYKKLLIPFMISLSSFGLSYAFLYLPSQSLNTPLDLYNEATINELTIDQLGLMTAFRLDVQSFFFGKADISTTVDVVKAEEKKIEVTYEPQTMDIDFDKLISQSNDSTLKNMHTYFKNVTPTSKNKYTGMFKDYNVILLTCEGFSPYAIDKELTPTLYKLANNGFVFKDFYTPLWNVSTSDGEYVAMQGLIPKAGTWSFRDSSSNYLPLTLGKQYQKLNYTTKAYHDHSYKYYGRNLSHPNLGYDYKGVGNGLNIKKQWPESDIEMMQKSVDDYINSDNFHTYYMTVSGHTNYTFSGNNMAAKNKNLVKDLDYSDLAKGYLATQIELDKAMEYLLTRLEESGKADKTLIAMSADHYPYGLPKENYNELAGHQLETNFEIQKNAFIIWSASMKEPIVVDKLGCSLDILPTVSNLLGLEYDSRLLMGTDLLSDSAPLVIFENKSFITDKVKYNSKTQKIEWLNGTKEDKEYLKKINTIVKQKIDYSEKTLDYDYYKKVFQ